MKTTHDLAALDWKLSGWTPHLWKLLQTMELGATPDAEINGIPALVPGSVQLALQRAGLLPDWNVGADSRQCEWVENRQWIYEASIPGEWLVGRVARLVCEGLDYSGSIMLNGHVVATFCGTHVPHTFDLTTHRREGDNALRIVFDLPPRWLGQIGYTSRVKEWKARFNYTWDWIPRLVQIGIWDAIRIEAGDGAEILRFGCTADADPANPAAPGILRVDGAVAAPEGARVRVRLLDDAAVVCETLQPAHVFNTLGIAWRDLPVDLWWPNLEGDQRLYTVTCDLIDAVGAVIDSAGRRVGFRNIAWRPCEGAPEGADPWLCVVNGRPIFLQGVNAAPTLPNFADLTADHYGPRLELYRDLGANLLRINGCGFLEHRMFYDLCDEMGIMVWQDAPLSSSGVDNLAPAEPECIDQMAAILRSYIERRRHHPSLIVWCGGNELQRIDSEGRTVPLGLEHPMLARLNAVVAEFDPGRRFLATTSTGPRFTAERVDFGKGLHWDVHGPWKPWDDLTDWKAYFDEDDALFRSETGAPGACSAELIRRYAGGFEPLPVSAANPLWRRPLTWWIEDAQFAAERGAPPATLDEYVDWSQDRQARALAIAVGACKRRFPRCGGIMLWMGHDCYPCPANTSIIDFDGKPKPAALAIQPIWRGPAGPNAVE